MFVKSTTPKCIVSHDDPLSATLVKRVLKFFKLYVLQWLERLLRSWRRRLIGLVESNDGLGKWLSQILCLALGDKSNVVD